VTVAPSGAGPPAPVVEAELDAAAGAGVADWMLWRPTRWAAPPAHG
jgi:hypothetical protein